MRLLFSFFLFIVSYKTLGQGVCNLTNIEKGGFTFDTPTEGCSPHSVTIKDISGGTNVKYIFNYKEEPKTKLASLVSSTNLSTIYTVPNQEQQVYIILQYGEKNGKEMYACQAVTVNPQKAPKYSYEACSNSKIVFKISDVKANDFDTYKVSFNGNTKTALKNVSLNENISAASINLKVEGFYTNPAGKCPITESKVVLMDRGAFFPRIDSLKLNEKGDEVTIVLSGNPDQEYGLSTRTLDVVGTVPNQLNPNKIKVGDTKIAIPNPEKPFCIAVGRQGNCQEVSDEVCTQPMKVIPDGEGYKIEWSSTPFDTKDINNKKKILNSGVYTSILEVKTTLKREENGSSSVLTTAINGPFEDKTADCNAKYNYILTTENLNAYSGYTDARHQNKAIFTQKISADRKTFKPPALTNITVSVENDKPKITFEDNSGWALNPKKYSILNNSKSIYSGNIQPFIDINNNPNLGSVCYQINYEDKCGSISLPSPTVCTIFLKNNNDALEWTPESPFGLNPPTNYEVISLDENTQLPNTETTLVAPKNTFSPDFSKFENEAAYLIKTSINGKDSYSNKITIPIKVSVFIPEAFTPNGDADNPDFRIFGNLKRIRTFKFEIFDKWGMKKFETDEVDFKWDGKDANEGIYAYKLSAILNNGEVLNKSGRILILR